MLYLKIPELISDSIITQHESIYKISKKNYNENSFRLAYKANTKHNFGMTVFETMIPKRIPLDAQTLTVIGLLEAEMTKKGNRGNVVFTNSEPDIINKVLYWFQKYFGICREQWKWLIEFNNKLVKYESSAETRSRELSSVYFWVKNVKMKMGNHFPKWCVYRGLNEGSLETENMWGTLIISHGNTILRKVISDILQGFPKYIDKLSNKELSFYLHGLFCGEGGVNHSNKYSVRRAFVSSFDEEILSRIQGILKHLKINFYESNCTVFVSDCKSMFQLYKYKIFDSHPEKWLDFLRILLSYKQFQGKSKDIESILIAEKNEMIQIISKLNELIKNRKNEFNTVFKKIQENIPDSIKIPMEVKLTGLALKPARLNIAKEVFIKPGITVNELVLKTGSTRHSAEHCISRLSEQGYLSKKHIQPYNRITLFPTVKLSKEIIDASDLRERFTERYKIPCDFDGSLPY